MKNTRNTNQPFVFFSIATLLLFIITSTGCDLIISTAETEGALPENIQNCESNEELCPNNSNDPSNPNFELPDIALIDGFSFDTPFVVNQNSFTLSWEVIDDNGNPINFDYDYSYALAGPGESISESDFQNIGSETSVLIENLQESIDPNDIYSFQIRATYESSKDTTFSGQFSVDAFQQRGFLFRPKNISDNGDGTYTAFIYLDEIQESDDLTAFSLVVNYNSTDFDVLQEDIIIYNENSFLKRDNAEIIGFSEINTGSITIDVGAAGTNLTPLSGGGGVCEITFRATTNFSGSSSISISTASELRASDGSIISIEGFDNADINQ